MQVKAPQVKLTYSDIGFAVVEKFGSKSPEAEATFQTLSDLEKNFGTKEFSPSQTLGVLNVMRHKATHHSGLTPVVELIQSLIDKEAKIDWGEVISYEQLKLAVVGDKRSDFVKVSGIMSQGLEHSDDVVKAFRLAQSYLDSTNTQYTDPHGNQFTVKYNPGGDRSYTVINNTNDSGMSFDINQRGLLTTASVLRSSSVAGEPGLSIEANYNPTGKYYDLSINEHANFAKRAVTQTNKCYEQARFVELNRAVKE